MKSRAALFLAIAALAIFGCRGVLGIDERDFEPDASTDGASTVDASSDAAPSDATADASAMDAAAMDADPAATICLDSGMDCPKCCHSAYMSASADFTQKLQATGCLCAPSPGPNCGGVCEAGPGCTLPMPSMTMPNQSCGTCVDHGSISADCKTADDQCAGDTACATYLTCLRSCFPP